LKFIDATALAALKHYIDQGLKPYQAAAIVGALMVESGLNPTAVGDRDLSVNAHGLAQWRGPRWDHMKEYAKAHNKSEFDLFTQLDFVLSELASTEKMAGDKLFHSDNVLDAVEAMVDFERPKGWTKKYPRHARTWRERLAQANHCLTLLGSESTMVSETSTSNRLDKTSGGF
jgi:hypothetical protein